MKCLYIYSSGLIPARINLQLRKITTRRLQYIKNTLSHSRFTEIGLLIITLGAHAQRGYLPVSSMGVCCARLTATRVLVYLLLSSFISLCYLTSTEMENLPSDVHPDLPRNEFIHKLIHLPAAELHRLRLDLFNEANNVYSLVLPELSNVPLVTRKDTAIKPISQKISEDVWTIVSSISAYPQNFVQKWKTK